MQERGDSGYFHLLQSAVPEEVAECGASDAEEEDGGPASGAEVRPLAPSPANHEQRREHKRAEENRPARRATRAEPADGRMADDRVDRPVDRANQDEDIAAR